MEFENPSRWLLNRVFFRLGGGCWAMLNTALTPRWVYFTKMRSTKNYLFFHSASHRVISAGFDTLNHLSKSKWTEISNNFYCQAVCLEQGGKTADFLRGCGWLRCRLRWLQSGCSQMSLFWLHLLVLNVSFFAQNWYRMSNKINQKISPRTSSAIKVMKSSYESIFSDFLSLLPKYMVFRWFSAWNIIEISQKRLFSQFMQRLFQRKFLAAAAAARAWAPRWHTPGGCHLHLDIRHSYTFHRWIEVDLTTFWVNFTPPKISRRWILVCSFKILIRFFDRKLLLLMFQLEFGWTSVQQLKSSEKKNRYSTRFFFRSVFF